MVPIIINLKINSFKTFQLINDLNLTKKMNLKEYVDKIINHAAFACLSLSTLYYEALGYIGSQSLAEGAPLPDVLKAFLEFSPQPVKQYRVL